MDNKYLFVTTFNKSGYDLYGKKMLNAFLSYWPKSQSIFVYTENVELDDNLKKDSRIIIKNLLDISDLVSFKERHRNNKEANGYHQNNPSVKNFQFDAVRFSHKIFAIYDCVCKNLNKSVVWLDADTITHSPVPDNFLETNFPSNEYGIAYLGRIKQYSECGWVVYHMTNPVMKEFWETFVNYYRYDTIFELDEWHDSYVFDVVKKEYESKGLKNHNITPGFIAGHPFINCVLGEYMDHMKGPRKTVGRSARSERHISSEREISWWKNN